MKATLIYNPNAAGARNVGCQDIAAMLDAVGIEAECSTTADASALDAAVAAPNELFVAAGGDGTLKELALRMDAHGVKVPVALVPLGTSNNIARTFGLDGEISELISGLAWPRTRSFDFGIATCGIQASTFLEGGGFGLFADAMHTHDPRQGKSYVRALQVALDTLSELEARRFRFDLDGVDASGEYIMVQVMNTPLVGPRLRLAPGADPGDGLFDVVMITEDERIGIGSYLTSLLAGDFDALPNVRVRRASRIEVEWTGFALHFDEELWPDPVATPTVEANGPGDKAALLTIKVASAALELWLPGSPTGDHERAAAQRQTGRNGPDGYGSVER